MIIYISGGARSGKSRFAQEMALRMSPNTVYLATARVWNDDFQERIRHQEELNSWMNDFVNVCPPEGESMIQMQSRVLDFWQELCRKPFSKTAVVTHGGVIRIILADIQKKPLKNAFEIKVGYGETFNIWARSYKE